MFMISPIKPPKQQRYTKPINKGPSSPKSMSDSHIVMMQILETKKMGDADIATKVSVQLQLTDPSARSRDRVVKKSEKAGFYTALDVGSVWLERALAGK